MHIVRLRRPLLALCLMICIAACAPTRPAPTPSSPSPPSATIPLPIATPTVAAAPTPPLTARNCLARGSFPPLLPGLRYGINIFLFGTDDHRVLTLAQSGEFSWVRQQIHWKDLEGTQGRFTWASLDHIVEETSSRGLKLMLSVVQSPTWATRSGRGGLPDDPAAFERFMRLMTARYAGRVAAYEVWNEPNLSVENGGTPATPEAYLPVLEAGFRAVKAADPCALVLAAPLAATATGDGRVATSDLQFYERLYALNNGAFLRAADAVAVHSGGGSNPPDALWPSDAPDQSAFYFRHIERIRAIMERYNDPRQVWITEFGWTVSQAQGAPEPVSLDQQSAYLVDALRLVRERYPWVAGVLVWNLNFSVLGPADDEKSTFGILNPDWTPRPAYSALQQAISDQRKIEQAAAPAIKTLDGGRSLPWYDWNFAGSGKMRTRPILAPDGTIYVVSDPGHLYALAPTGALRWSFDTTGETRDSPTLDSGRTIYLGDANGNLTALAPNGSKLWNVALPSAARGSPVVFDDIVAIASGSVVLAFDETGHERWQVDLGSELSPLERAEDGLLVGTATGELVLLDKKGNMRWRKSLGGAIGKRPVAAPDDGTFVLLANKTLVALDSSGDERWRADLSAESAAAPLAFGDAVAVTARDGTLTLFDAASGQLRWRISVGSDLVATPAMGSERIFVGNDDGLLVAIDLEGTIRWQAKLAGMARSQPAIDENGVVYITTTAGRVYAIESR